MKAIFVILVVCLVVLVAITWAAPPPEFKAAIDAMRKECQQKVGATEDDIKDLKPPHLPKTEGGKKVLACMMKEDKTIVDGKFSVEGSLEVVRKALEGHPEAEERMKLAKGVAETCSKQLDEKPAASEEELAISILTCLHKGSKEKGVINFSGEEDDA